MGEGRIKVTARRLEEIAHSAIQLPRVKESEIINMDAVKKLISQSLEQQKSHFVEILDRQADTFNKFVKVIMDSTNERLDAMNRNIQELKDSIHYNKKDIDEIKIKVPKLSMDHNTLENGFRKICDCLVTLESKADYLENQSRRNNLIFDGLKESFCEKWEDTEKHVRKCIFEKLNLDASALAIERAHRVGKLDYKEERQRPRPIVVKFLNFKDRELVWRNRKELKTTAPGVYINEDFSEMVRQKRK